MPRDLWHLEGQQLRLLQRKAMTIVENAPNKGVCLSEAAEIAEIIDEILADGPHSRDETC